MPKIILNNGAEFDMAFGGPVSVTENIVFLASIINSDVDTVHNAFKEPENTSVLTTYLIDDPDEEDPQVYTGYIRYCGFSVEADGSILVTLKKNLGV